MTGIKAAKARLRALRRLHKRTRATRRGPREMRKLAKRNIRAVSKSFSRLRKNEKAKAKVTPRTIALLFLPYKPGLVPSHPQMATEFRYTVAKTRALQRYCRRGLVLTAMSLASISLAFLIPWPWGLLAWATTAYAVGKVARWNKSCHSEQLAFVESTYRLGGYGSTYRLGGYGSTDWDVSAAEQMIGLQGLSKLNIGVVIGKSGPGKSMMLDDPYAASTVSGREFHKRLAALWGAKR